MTTITLEIRDSDETPDLDPLFDFIDSPDSAPFLSRATSGELGFRECFDILRRHGAVPQGSANRVWNIVIKMYVSTRSDRKALLS